MKNKLVELCRQAHRAYLKEDDAPADFSQYMADYLIANGVRNAREIFEEIEKEIELAIECNRKARIEHLNKLCIYDNFTTYCDGKIHAMRGLLDFLAKLKKKYTGDVK